MQVQRYLALSMVMDRSQVRCDTRFFKVDATARRKSTVRVAAVWNKSENNEKLASRNLKQRSPT
jgi:hypothetical protein